MINNKIKTIDRIEFGILSSNEIVKMSFMGQDSQGIEVYELYDNGTPKANSLIDTRFGPANPTDICATCGLTTDYCAGHSSHITLAEKMFHAGYLDYIKKILSCICLKCSKILIHKNENEIREQLSRKPPIERLARLKKLVSTVPHCQKCGSLVTKIKKEKKAPTGMNYLVSEANLQNITNEEGVLYDKKKSRYVLTPDLVYGILQAIPPEDNALMGLKDRPENMVYSEFYVPPICMRPSAKADFTASQRLENDSTLVLADTVKANIKLKKYKEEPVQKMKAIAESRNLLQNTLYCYFDNSGACDQKGKTRKPLTQRIKSKEGRIRQNLMGKRVNYSGRTVITPDPQLDINELGMPIKIAKNLTFPEIVTPYNIEKLQKLVFNARNVYPGANFVRRISRDGNEITTDLRFAGEKIVLQYGDTVDRQLVNGDYVILNRQPTLHKLSMMGHKIKVIENDDLQTFRLNPNVTTPYNADFDGDEMNIHVPQSYRTMIEIQEAANVQKQLINPKSGSPAIGTVQDVLSGSFNLTKNTTQVNWRDAMNILAYTDVDIYNVEIPRNKISGIDLFSYIIPENININNNRVIIENGKIIQGQLNKSHLGPSTNSILHNILDQYGDKPAVDFLNNVQRLANNYNLYRGFTTGIGDSFIDNDLEKEAEIMIQKKIVEINNRITTLENNPNMVDPDTFEASIYSSLNTVLSNLSDIVDQKMSENNGFKIMKDSGAKGGLTNLGQMCICIGQQNLEAARPKRKNNGRTFPYFFQNDDTPEARGFIRSSFIKGQTPTEFMFQNGSSREGVMDTAIKTAESGYIQRRIVKATEDISVANDSTVRNSRNHIIQFVYGDDGLDVSKQFSYQLMILILDNKQVLEKYGNKFGMKLIKLRDIIRYNIQKQAAEYQLFNHTVMLPINLNRIILNARKLKTSKNEVINAEYVLKHLKDILDYKNTKTIAINNTNYKNTIKYKDERQAKLMFKLAIYSSLAPKICLEEYGFNKEQFDYIVNEIIRSFNKGMVEPGEMVGALSATSIGEPTTQLTLNTFHHAGIGSKSTASLGVPRIKEIMNCSTNLKTAYMTIYLNDQFKGDINIINEIASHLKYTTMKHIMDNVQVLYEPLMFDEGNIMQKDNVKNTFKQFNQSKLSCSTEINKLPWLIRITLNREKLMEKNITLLDIKTKFCDNWEKRYKNTKNVKAGEKGLVNKIIQCAILSNNDSDTVPIIHIRLDLAVVDINTLNQFIEIFIENFKLKGLDNINDVNGIDIDTNLVSFNKETGALEKTKNTIISTDGVDLVAIKYINGIDFNKLVTNDIVAIYNNFGVEAARNKIINELNAVFSAQNVDFHHLSIVADIMTHYGVLTSIDRHGLQKLDNDPLAKASFEKPVEQLLNAAVFHDVDTLKSVSSRIMTGLAIKGGTGLCNIILDYDMLENSEYDEDINYKYKKKVNEITEDSMIKDLLQTNVEEDEIYIPY
ncbi:DNA-directed RNA polymerase subunit alpha [Hokovirus HKV1]|uniref:DNA-directed RNA polymerase subunit n=1 Tax=Hokovirus HKV1 TaxID=1977638 RepID=A0A1V0SGA6_9VIRU|nr:DNA-directed RNA polymerase subunit alpha [Hokovirus HKV1]